MYSRSRISSDPPFQIPKHYSGCAFTTAPRPTQHPTEVPIETVCPPPSDPQSVCSEVDAPAEKALPVMHSSKEPCEKPMPPPPLQGLLGNFGIRAPFSQGIGFDELLILGLMLLLSHNESDPDILLFLGLLLFCG